MVPKYVSGVPPGVPHVSGLDDCPPHAPAQRQDGSGVILQSGVRSESGASDLALFITITWVTRWLWKAPRCRRRRRQNQTRLKWTSNNFALSIIITWVTLWLCFWLLQKAPKLDRPKLWWYPQNMQSLFSFPFISSQIWALPISRSLAFFFDAR